MAVAVAKNLSNTPVASYVGPLVEKYANNAVEQAFFRVRIEGSSGPFHLLYEHMFE